jgi:hypothetical protein
VEPTHFAFANAITVSKKVREYAWQIPGDGEDSGVMQDNFQKRI